MTAPSDHEAHREASTTAALLQDSAEDLYENAPCGYLSAYPDGTIARVNRTFLTWTGYSQDDLVGTRRFVDLLTAGGRIYHETHIAPLLRMQGSVRAIALDLKLADGTVLPVLVNAHLVSDPEGVALAQRITVFDASDRKEYERELLAARRRAETTAARLRVVEQVVADLAAVSRVADVSAVMVRAGVEAFGATVSAMWLADSSTGVYRWAGVVPEALVPHALDIPADDALPQSAALLAGEVVLLDATAATTIPEVLTSLGTPSGTLVLTPLAALDRTLGVLALGFDVDRHLEPDELELFKTLGRQAGQAVERAALFDEQRSVAETLQRSLLPRDVPDDPRLTVAAVYRPAVDGLDVGGDWFDAFHLDRDRVGLVVGDVVGRGLHAAAAMGQLRSAVRALATTDAGPALLLNRLDRFVAGVEAADTATMVYAELDLRDGRLRYACAGHPPPVLVGAGGISDLLWGGRSAPLGAHFSTRTARRGRDDHRPRLAARPLHRRPGRAPGRTARRAHRGARGDPRAAGVDAVRRAGRRRDRRDGGDRPDRRRRVPACGRAPQRRRLAGVGGIGPRSPGSTVARCQPRTSSRGPRMHSRSAPASPATTPWSCSAAAGTLRPTSSVTWSPSCRSTELPGFLAPVAPGHRGLVRSYDLDGTAVLAYLGRTHLYEGHGRRPGRAPGPGRGGGRRPGRRPHQRQRRAARRLAARHRRADRRPPQLDRRLAAGRTALRRPDRRVEPSAAGRRARGRPDAGRGGLRADDRAVDPDPRRDPDAAHRRRRPGRDVDRRRGDRRAGGRARAARAVRGHDAGGQRRGAGRRRRRPDRRGNSRAARDAAARRTALCTCRTISPSTT